MAIRRQMRVWGGRWSGFDGYQPGGSLCRLHRLRRRRRYQQRSARARFQCLIAWLRMTSSYRSKEEGQRQSDLHLRATFDEDLISGGSRVVPRPLPGHEGTRPLCYAEWYILEGCADIAKLGEPSDHVCTRLIAMFGDGYAQLRCFRKQLVQRPAPLPIMIEFPSYCRPPNQPVSALHSRATGAAEAADPSAISSSSSTPSQSSPSSRSGPRSKADATDVARSYRS